ncbi:hypothetical protein D3C80_2115610 [compost metagenome]
MGDTRGKIPQITRTDIGDEIAPVLINGGNPGTPQQHIGPFRLLMPVQLPDAARRQAHIDTC